MKLFAIRFNFIQTHYHTSETLNVDISGCGRVFHYIKIAFCSPQQKQKFN